MDSNGSRPSGRYDAMMNTEDTTMASTSARPNHRGIQRPPGWWMLVLCWLAVSPVQAGPQGGAIVAGSGSIQSPSHHATVVQQDSATLSIDWDSFNLAAGESVRFIQPDAQSAALNFINDQQPSVILGSIDANGQVLLMNPNGMMFGASARVDVGALVAGAFRFDQPPGWQPGTDYALSLGPGAVSNAGVIRAAEGGNVALLGDRVSNSGSIEARLGRIDLLSADAATLSFDADGLIRFAISAENRNDAGGGESPAVDNSGQLVADGGYVVLAAAAADALYATVVNNSGLIRATAVSDSGGVVRLVGSGGNVIHRGVIDVSAANGGSGGEASLMGERVGVLDNALIDASGRDGGGRIHLGGGRAGEGASARFTQLAGDARLDADALNTGNGGEIVLWAEDTTWSQGSISASGGRLSGDGGFVEVSGLRGLVMQSDVDVRAPNGNWGTLLLDPTDIVIFDQADGAQADDGALPDLSDATAGTGSFNIGELALEGLAASSNLVLEATNNITINNLADNVLAMATDNLGSITITADSDGDGSGAFVMDATDTISTQGGAVTISGAGVTIGMIDTDGPGSTDGAISVTSSASLVMGSSTAGTETLSVVVDSDANGIETLTLTGSLTGGSVTLSGGGDVNDTLVGPDLANSWDISALNTGTLNGAGFSNFPNLTGGSADDSFTITGVGSLGGIIDGGAHSSGDSVDYSAASGLVTVVLATDISNVEALIGGGADYTLVAPDLPNTWTITGQNDGSVAGLTFTDFSNLIGGSDTDDYVLSGGSVSGTIDGAGGANSLYANDIANNWNILSADGGNVDNVFAFTNIANLIGGTGVDTFTLNGGTISGTADGGAGSDSLAADNVANVWNITATDAGDVTGVAAFVNMENLNGRNDTDDFTILDGAGLSGTLNGGGGTDSVDLSAQGTALVVDLGSGGYANIEKFTGNGNATLIGDNIANTWVINADYDASDDGTLNGAVFIDFGTLVGGSGDDSFTLSGGVLTGTISGGGGNDTLVADNVSNSWVISSADSGTVNGIGGFADIDNLTGNALDDSFVFTAGGSLSGTIDGGADNDSVDLSGLGGAVVVNIGAGGFLNIESFVGNGSNSTLIGDDIVNEWSITALNAGQLNGTTNFSGFNNLTGGSDADTFTISGGSIAGTADGGAGNDTLVADNIANTWTISATDAGGVDGVAAFTGIENLTGNTAADYFRFDNGSSISGTVNGAAGGDTIDLSAQQGALVVDLDNTNYLNIETFIGNDTDSTLLGPDQVTSWTLSGPNDGTVNAINFFDFNNLTGNNNSDSFTVFGGTLSGTLSGGNGSDSLRGSDSGELWTFSGTDVGSLTSIAAFDSIESLTGGNGVDIFRFDNGAGFSGSIDGGAGSDQVDLSAQLGTVVVDLGNPVISNIESYLGNGADSTIIATDSDNLWAITGTDSGDVNGIAFSGFNNITGNSRIDQFVLSGGTISGTIDGAGGSDSLTADNVANTWNILATDNGSVTGVGSFVQVENLTGGSALDAFAFANGSSISGRIDGGDGTDSVDLSQQSGTISVDLGGGDFSNVESFIGNDQYSTLIGPLSTNTWTIVGTNDGSVGTVNFTNFNNLTGNVSIDNFVFQNGSSITGSVDGGSGVDTVDQSLQGGSVTVNLDDGSYVNIENFTGNNSSSTLVGQNRPNSWNITGQNDGSVGTFAFADFNNLIGNADSDAFILNGGSISGTIDGAGGNDSLSAGNTTNTWNIVGVDSGSVTGVGAFLSIENLQGNAGVDDFLFANGGLVSGTVSGGTGQDSVDMSLQSNVMTVTLGSTGFDAIESFTGNGERGTIAGDDITNSWVISGVDSGTVGTVTFINFGNIRGGSADDSFTISGGTISGQVDGGAGSDLILGDSGDNVWNISGADVGDITGIGSFVNIETLSGNSGADNFVFANGSSFSGVLDGGGGVDTVDFSSEDGTLLVSLASGQYQNIENFIGNSLDSTLLGENLVSDWTITGTDAGVVNGIAFSGFNNLLGNDSIDTFTLQSGSITGIVDGGAGSSNDTIQADDVSNTWTIDAVDAGTVTGIAGFRNINNLSGGASSDVFDIAADVSGTIGGGAGADTFNVGGLVSVGAIVGGSEQDVLSGPAQDSSWTVSGADAGSLNGIVFSEVESLQGGAGVDLFTVTNAADAAISGGISAGAGDDSLAVDYSLASNRVVDFSGGSGTDSVVLGGGGASVINSYVYGPATGEVSVVSGDGSLSQTVNAREIEAVADSMTADTLSVSGSDGSDAIGLDAGNLNGTASVVLQMGGFAPLEFTNKANLVIDTGLGSDSISINGAVTIGGDVTVNAETVASTAAGRLSASSLILNQVTNIGSSGNPLQTDINTLVINGPSQDVFVRENSDLALTATSVSGTLNVSTVSGDITSAGPVVVAGTSSFSVGDNNSILLDDTGNQFAGTPTFSSTGTLNDLVLYDNSAVALAALDMNGNLTVTAVGAITQQGALTVQGNSVFDAGANAITLDAADNDFVGSVSLRNTGGANVSIVDQNALELGAVNVGSGELSVSAGSITQSGAVVQEAGAGTTRFEVSSGDMLLDNAGNDFTGVVQLVNSGVGNVAITDANTLSLGTSSTNGGNLVVTGADTVTLSGTTTSANGDIEITATAGDIQLGSLDAGTGTITLTATTGNLIGDNSPVTSPNLSAQNLVITTGQTLGDYNNPIAVNVAPDGSSLFVAGEGSANIIGFPGTILAGSVLVNDVAATRSAVGQGQSVSYLAYDVRPEREGAPAILFTVDSGALLTPSRFDGLGIAPAVDDEDERRK